MLRGSSNWEGERGRGESGSVPGTVDGMELTEQQFSKLLFAVTHGERRIFYCDLVQVYVCAKKTLVS